MCFLTKKFFDDDKKNLSIGQNFFVIKNTFKANLHDIFNVFILFNTVSQIKLSFRLKIYPKLCTFKNLEEFLKASGNPVSSNLWFNNCKYS